MALGVKKLHFGAHRYCEEPNKVRMLQLPHNLGLNSMSKSLYLRLLQNQSSDERENLENFLSEGLCDLLNRLSRNEQTTLLTRLLSLDSLDLKKGTLHWEAQVGVETLCGFKYPDIVGFMGNTPQLVIESKVNAEYTWCQDEHGNWVHQLAAYGNWLNKINPKGVLVLLTSGTKPPHGFIGSEGDQEFGTQARRVITWQALHDVLHQVTELNLAKDFRLFLRERSLAVDNPTRQDFGTLEIYFSGPHQRIIRVLSTIRENLKGHFKNGFSWGLEEKYMYKGVAFEASASLIYSYGFLNVPGYEYYHWGVRFPIEERDGWEFAHMFPNQPGQPYIYCGYSTRDKDRAQHFIDNMPDNWLPNQDIPSNEDIFAGIACTDLGDMLAKGNFMEDMYGWVVDRFQEMNSTVGIKE